MVLIESFTHDADGNMTTRTNEITDDTITFAWDDFDKLMKVSSADLSGPTNTAKVDNRFDVNGIRKRKLDKAGNASAEYTTDITTLASDALGTSTLPTISYIQGHLLLGYEEDGDFRYFLTDALGAVRDIVDDTGTVIKSYEFDEYGNLLSSSGSGTTSPKTWIGGLSVNDDTADSGLYLMGYRHYAGGVLGRFINRDPIGHAGNLNLYAYSGNPVNFADPSGLAYITIQHVGSIPGKSLCPRYPANAKTKNPPTNIPIYTVKLHSSDGTVLAEANWATSGLEGAQPGMIDPSHQTQSGFGPTPRGIFRIFCGEIADSKFPWDPDTNAGDRTGLDSPGWGGARVLLNPVKGFEPGFPFGRSEMYLHLHRGDSTTRTAGCVGMIREKGGDDFFDQLHEVCKKLAKIGYGKNGISPSLRVDVRH